MKTKLNGILTLLLALVVQVAFAQQTVTGKVTDPAGEPILGATVLIRGSSNATTTDFDGNYSITANPNDILSYRFSGYEAATITVGVQLVINVSMKTSLDAVVVTGYRTSTQAKSNVSVSTVTSATIENRPNASFAQTLSGQVAGLNIQTSSGQPGANSLIQLRGVGSISGNTEPLFILDGSPIDEDNFRSLNPQEIESVTVLKDAGATSIYGNRGSNGVIIIKTRQGSFNQPLKINATSIFAYTSLPTADYGYMNSQEYLTIERSRNAGFGANGIDFDVRDASIPSAPLTDAEIAAYPTTDWRKVFFRTGTSKNSTVTLSSGGENSRQFTSIGYFDQDGILVQSNLQRFNIRSNVSGNSKNGRFDYALNLNTNYSKSDEPSNIGTGAVNRNFVLGATLSVPYLSRADYINSRTLVDQSASTDALFRRTPLLLLDLLAQQQRQDEEVKVVGSMNFGYKLSDNITVRSITGIDYQNEIASFLQPSGGWNALYFANDDNEGLSGVQTINSSRQFSINQLTSLNYNKTFNEKHTLNAGLYTEYFKAHFRGFGIRQEGLDPRTTAFMDGSGNIADNPDNDLFVDTTNAQSLNSGLFSYFGSADYDYDSKYGLGLTLRRDASSRFSNTNRWATFYSVSARWNIDKEEFWGPNNPFDALKLRGSYGTTGNQNISGGGYFSGLNLTRDQFATGAGYAGNNGLFPTVFGNSALLWETSKQYNVGVDFALLDNRLRGSFDAYYEDTEDLFQSAPISGTVGTGGYSLNANFGLLTNKGFDFELRYDLLRPASGNPGGLAINVNFIGNVNENIIRDLPTEDGTDQNLGREGGPIGDYFTIPYAGVNPANGNLLFRDIDGNLTESPNADTDRRFLGKNLTPEFQGSFGLNVDYKNFFLQTQWNYATGLDRFDNDLNSVYDPTQIGQFNVSRDLFRAWTPDNRITDIPSLDATNINAFGSTRFLKKADYLRLRFISFGYGFDRTVLEKINLTNLRIFVNAENLVTFTEWRGFDASSNTNGTYTYPTPRIVSLGVEIGI
jgi:TonB-linked SusC/RagA family outer membrane protein